VHAFVVGFFALLISSPWWWYNYSLFGSVMPQSGLSESLDDELVRNAWMALTVFTDALSVFFFLPKAIEVSNLVSIGWFVVVVIGLWFVNVKTRFFGAVQRSIHYFALMPLIFVCIGFAVYYILFFSAPHFIPRYFQPFRIFFVILAAVALPHIAEQVRNSRSGKRLLRLFLLAAFLFSFVRYGYAFYLDYVGEFYQMGKWALKTPDAKIGMYQSGTVGFIAPNITNLDGKVNHEALEARQYGHFGAYIASQRFDYIADWKEMVVMMTTAAEPFGEHFEEVDSLGRIHIYKRVK
jgi:hypothetical protein